MSRLLRDTLQSRLGFQPAKRITQNLPWKPPRNALLALAERRMHLAHSYEQ